MGYWQFHLLLQSNGMTYCFQKNFIPYRIKMTFGSFHFLFFIYFSWSTRPTTVPAGSDHYFHTECPSVLPYIPKLQNQATITAGRDCGLAEWIIDDSCLVMYCLVLSCLVLSCLPNMALNMQSYGKPEMVFGWVQFPFFCFSFFALGDILSESLSPIPTTTFSTFLKVRRDKEVIFFHNCAEKWKK